MYTDYIQSQIIKKLEWPMPLKKKSLFKSMLKKLYNILIDILYIDS